jgi:peptidoglycan/xylan/chitin deacetylase (PgdA/CDA1 family)
MKRRSFIKNTTLGSLVVGFPYSTLPEKTHILTLSFDDGFKKSFYKIAEIFETFDLRACLNVIASGHLSTFKKVDDWILPELMGDFDDWNMLKSRGHEIMPHSWQHLNLVHQPFEKAKALITRCLEYFQEHLEGFETSKAVFNFPFNASTPELEKFALSQVRAIRTNGASSINAIPISLDPVVLGCRSMGPEISITG